MVMSPFGSACSARCRDRHEICWPRPGAGFGARCSTWVRRRPNGDRIEEYFVVLGEIGGRVAIDECRPSGPTGLEQRSVREKPRHRLHVPYLFSPTANDLTDLKQPAAARLSARGKRAANNQHSEPIIEKMPAPSVRHVRPPQLSSVSQRPP